jgi:hypothetical protein
MSCAFTQIPNAHQMRKPSARLLTGAYREKGKRATARVYLFPKGAPNAQLSRQRHPPMAFKLFAWNPFYRRGTATLNGPAPVQ